MYRASTQNRNLLTQSCVYAAFYAIANPLPSASMAVECDKLILLST